MGGLPGVRQRLHGHGQGAGGQIGQPGGAQDEQAAVLHDQSQPFGALGIGPADPGLAVGELDGGGPPDEPDDPAAMVMNDLRECVADGLAGAQIVLLGEQFGGADLFVRLQRAHGQFGEHDRGWDGPEDGGGKRRRFHPSRFHPKDRSASGQKFRPRLHDRSGCT